MQWSNAQTDQLSVKPAAEPLAVVTAVLGPLIVILFAGILVIQLEAAQHGGLLDLNSRVVRIGGEWLPYIVRTAFVLLALAAALVYRRMIRTNAMRRLTLIVLIIATVAALYAFQPLPDDGQHHPLILFAMFYGAASPFTLALIAAVIADIIFVRRTLHGS